MARTGVVSLVGFAAVAVALVVAADSPQEKLLADQQGNAGHYTTSRIDRDGGDSCVDAPTIAVSPYNDAGNTTGYADTWGPTVSGYGQDGEDQAYLIVVATADTITVTVTPTDSGFDLSTYLISDASCTTYNAPVLAGVDVAYGGQPETFSYSAAPGTYVIVVDSFLPGEVGPFTIEVLSNVPVELSALSAD